MLVAGEFVYAGFTQPTRHIDIGRPHVGRKVNCVDPALALGAVGSSLMVSYSMEHARKYLLQYV